MSQTASVIFRLRALRKGVGIGMIGYGALQFLVLAASGLLLVVANRMAGAPFPGSAGAFVVIGGVQALAYLAIGVWVRRTSASVRRAPLVTAMALTGVGFAVYLVQLSGGTGPNAAGIVGALLAAALFVCSAVALRTQPSPTIDGTALEPAG